MILGDDLLRDQDVPEALHGLLLHCEGLVKLLLGEGALGDEGVSDPVGGAGHGRVGGHDVAAFEDHVDRLARGRQMQGARLPLKSDELDDVGQTEVLERSCERHIP